jgi:hypothetical protein
MVRKGHLFVSNKGEVTIPLDFAAKHFQIDFDDEQPVCELPTCSPIVADEVSGEIMKEKTHAKVGKRFKYSFVIRWSVRSTRKLRWIVKSKC